MISRRAALAGGLAATVATGWAPRGRAAETPGVTKTGLKIGSTMPYSGPASAYAAIGKGDTAFFQMLNDQGGIDGHKIDFISLDDGYSPPRTVEDVRKLIEQDQVDFLFNTLGTPGNSAIERYMNSHKIPQLFVATGAAKWDNPKKYPWTIGWQPSYRTEAQIYTKYMLASLKEPKLAILYQNDDFGKDYPIGVRDILGDNWNKVVVKTSTYETTDPTVNSQISTLHSSGANALLVAATPKFAAQAIKAVHNENWQPMFFMTNVSISVGAVMDPAGPQNAVGIITSAYLKDPTDPTWDNDPGMKEWRAWMGKYLPGADQKDGSYVYAYSASSTMAHVLRQCNGDFSRQNVLKQATSIQKLALPTLLPGITVNTSATDYRPISALQLAKWDGKTWARFGEIIEGQAKA